MSHCTCEHCGAILTDSPRGYVTGCVHYPADIQMESESNMKTEHFSNCCRGACKASLNRGRWRIWNNAGAEPSFRDYCIRCGRRIMEYNRTLPEDQHMRASFISPDHANSVAGRGD